MKHSEKHETPRSEAREHSQKFLKKAASFGKRPSTSIASPVKHGLKKGY